MMKKLAWAVALMCVCTAALADGGECQATAATRRAAQEHLQKAEAAERAGRLKEAYESAMRAPCDDANSPVERGLGALRRRTSLKLGEAAEAKGELAEALPYYRDHYHGIAEDRVRFKMAAAKPVDFNAFQEGVFHLRRLQRGLKESAAQAGDVASVEQARWLASKSFRSRDTAEAMDPERDARLAALDGHLSKLQVMATKEGEKHLADEEQIFTARRKSVTAKRDSIDELTKSRDWLGLFGQAARANERAVKRADALLAEGARNSLELALQYYEFADDARGKRRAQDRALGLADAHMSKGEKKVAAEYYRLAGLGDKASALEQSFENEREQSEAARQKTFKKEQDDLERALKM